MTKRRAGSQNRELDCQFDSRPEKVRNRPYLLGCRRRATYRWKAIDEGYNFALDHVAIRALYKKLCALKVPGMKSHLDVGSLESHKVYYMGEGGGFPRVRAVVSLVCPSACGLSQHPRVSRMLN
jgi:hypothetical protein